MRIARRRDHLQRVPNPSIHSDRIHAHEVCAVRRAEEKAAATIKRDVREAFGERPCADELERTGTWIDAVAVRLVRLGTHRGDERALVRAHGIGMTSFSALKRGPDCSEPSDCSVYIPMS